MGLVGEMEQLVSAAAAANNSDEVHTAPKPAILEDPSALQLVLAKLEARELCALVQVSS
jgi:hypothetical protein